MVRDPLALLFGSGAILVVPFAVAIIWTTSWTTPPPLGEGKKTRYIIPNPFHLHNVFVFHGSLLSKIPGW